VKFSPEGGTIDIAAQVTGGFARIEVRDQGPGVPEGFEEKIFEPFRQVESSDARPRGGSGLGLAIARAIVREHGGAIGYEPRPGGGSIFWFTVPLAGDPS
jgi:signal transduction histidine kinase